MLKIQIHAILRSNFSYDKSEEVICYNKICVHPFVNKKTEASPFIIISIDKIQNQLNLNLQYVKRYVG